jgi:hypothetical protein
MTGTFSIGNRGEEKLQKSANKSLLLMKRKPRRTAGYPFAGIALKVLEPYAVKIARTVLRGRKLPGCPISIKQQ